MINKLYMCGLALFSATTFSAFGQTQPSQDENGYYLIENAEHLKWFRDQVNATKPQQVDTNGDGQIDNRDDPDETVRESRMNVKLMEDIDLSATGSWTPIGEYDNGLEGDIHYAGVFDGQGHTIKGLNVTPSSGRQSYGLFGYVSYGTVKNLGVVESNINGTDYVGAICGMLSYGTIDNCFSTATVIETGDEADVGGLTGGMRKTSRVVNSYHAGNVKATGGIESEDGAIWYPTVGGITSYIGGEAYVENCYNAGLVSASFKEAKVGAIAGDDYKEYMKSARTESGEEKAGIIDCYYLEGTGIGNVAQALSASDFVTTINQNLFNAAGAIWVGDAKIEGGELLLPTFIDGMYAEIEVGGSTAIESLESVESHVRAIDGRICITTSESMKVRVVNIAGQTVRSACLSDGYSEITGLSEGLYIVVLEDGTCVKVLLR